MVPPSSQPTPDIDGLVEALVEGDRSRVEALFETERKRGSFLAAIDELVQPAMAEIGAAWERGELTVAEEHLATATMQTVIARQLGEMPIREEEDRSILLACVEDNEHELGLRVLADAFELAGWRARCLGADVPTEALVAMVDRWRPDVVALSLSMRLHVPVAREAVDRIRELGDPQPTVLLGGRLADHDSVLEQTGADGWAANLRQGLEAIEA